MGVHPTILTKKKMAVLGVLGLATGLVTYGAPAPARTAETAQVVKITASKFHFTPDHIVLAKGQPVTLQLTSADRTHGFMVRAFGMTPTSSRARRPRSRSGQRRSAPTPPSAITTADLATAG